MRAISHIRRTPTTTQFGSGGHLEVTVLAATLSYTAPPPAKPASSALTLREGGGEAETKAMELEGELGASTPDPSAPHPHQQPHKLLRECLVRVDLRAWDSAGGGQAGGQVRKGGSIINLTSSEIQNSTFRI